MLPLGLFSIGCSPIQMVDRTTNNVIEGDFSKEAKALTTELDDYDEYEPVFLEDNQQVAVTTFMKTFVKEDASARKANLDPETVDFQVFEGEKGIYYMACIAMSGEMPYTIFLKIESSDLLTIKPLRVHMAAYGVNISKSFLLYKADTLALISQRPFSTFEEVYFFKEGKDKFELSGRGWHDSSIIYYEALNKLLDEGKYDEAMNLPDESMYPMSYEAQMFNTANHMIQSTILIAKDEGISLKKRSAYMAWALNYYFQNHYGLELEEAATLKFTNIKEQKSDDFGADYRLSNAELAKAIEVYANLLAKEGKESMAEQLRTSAKSYLQ